MTKQLFSLLLLLGGLTALNSASAQIKLNINLGAQPKWGPVGYDKVDYYYMPEHDVYYDVARKQFVYSNGSEWVFDSKLPAKYGNVNLYNTYKAVVNEPRPYLHDDVYREKYAKNKSWKGERQIIIRDSKDDRYFKGDPNHPGNNGRRLGQYKNGNKGNHDDDDDDDKDDKNKGYKVKHKSKHKD